jgi:dolichol-phosphate mannosyltransferase
VFNEQENILVFYEKLVSECRKLHGAFEIIFVDDGSTDNTITLLCELQNKDNSIKVIKLSRNHGHQLALSAGIDHAVGDYAITMDADLQHPPELIPRFLEKAVKGFDIVTGVKTRTEKRGAIKNLLASVFYTIYKKITNINVRPNASDFRLYSKKAYQVMQGMRERERYLRGIAEWIGFEHASIHFVSPERYAGKPKYTLMKLARLASHGIFSFSAFPLRISAYIGLVIVFLNILYILYALYAWLVEPGKVPGYTSLVIIILFLFSWLFLSIGILGEYVLRIYEEVKGRPLYVIDWKKGFDETLS